MLQMLWKYAKYIVPFVSVGISILLIRLVPTFRDRGAFIIFLAAVSISAWYGGWIPAAIATLLSVVAAAWFVLRPYDSIGISDEADVLRLALFLLVSVLISLQHSQRKSTQRALERSEQRLALALEAAHMGVWDSDLRTGEFNWSPGLERIFGRDSGCATPTFDSFLSYIHPEDQDFLNRAAIQRVDLNKDFEIEHRIVRPDGEVRWVVTRGRIYCNADGVAERVVAVAIDITASKKREAAARPA